VSAQHPLMPCITPRCTNNAKTRGLCGSCYAAAAKAVKRGEATWEYLQGLDPPLALPIRRKSGRLPSPFGAALAHAVKATPPTVQPIEHPPADTPDPTVEPLQAAHATADGPESPVAPVVPTVDRAAERKAAKERSVARRAIPTEIAIPDPAVKPMPIADPIGPAAPVDAPPPTLPWQQ